MGTTWRNFLRTQERQAFSRNYEAQKDTVEATAGSHSDYTYRYFNRHFSYTAMGLGTTFQVLDALDGIIDTVIGASASAGKFPDQ